MLLSLAAPALSHAQPVITNAGCAPSVGTVAERVTGDFLPAGSGGANVVWDFSQINQTIQYSHSYVTTVTGNYVQHFPDAGLLRVTSGGEYYYQSKADGFYFDGGYLNQAGGILLVMQDNQKLMQYPMTYNDLYADSASATFSLAISGWRKCYDTVTADGWGKLILPDDEYLDVLRVRTRSFIIDSFGTSKKYMTEEIFDFYKEGYHTPLLTIHESKLQGSSNVIRSLTYRAKPLFTEDPPRRRAAVFPNPAKNAFTVSLGDDFDKAGITVLDIQGRTLCHLPEVKNGAQIDCAFLAPGNYFVRIQSETISKLQMLMIER